MGLLILSICTIGMLSFTIQKQGQDFLKQLGISESTAKTKIESNIIYGNFDVYGLSKAKNLNVDVRKTVALEILNYIKSYTDSESFKQAYENMRNDKKPKLLHMASPEEMRTELIRSSKASLAEIEKTYQKSDASLKKVYENLLIEAKKQLKEAEDPNNPMLLTYANNYESTLEHINETNNRLKNEWETAYPANHMQFVKMRMNEYLEETVDIDFNAVLVTKDGKKVFYDNNLEQKSSRWKLAFRCGKETVDVSRNFIKTWMAEIP